MSTVARLKIKEIDRDQKMQWMVVINTTVHVKSYLLKIQSINEKFSLWELHACEKFVM